METFGGYGVARVPRLQHLLRYICEQGFEHHVAINQTAIAPSVYEALSKYLAWEVYHHSVDAPLPAFIHAATML
ncbi:MAG TPA: hypothetical protein VFU49_24190 [Ktedonobacteraceae bacterium]|nr:hypothetical protein [Ktedonobacteraceae bacterium]